MARVRRIVPRYGALECTADASRPRIYLGEADARGSRSVVGENSSRELALASRYDRERLAGLQISNRARDRPEDAGLAAARDLSGIRRFLEQASDACGMAGNHRHDLAAHAEHAAIDERRRGRDRNIIDEKLRGRAVGAIDHEIEALDDLASVVGIERDGELLDCQPGIDIVQMTRGGFDLGMADIGAGIDDLAMEIGYLDRVGIDQPEAARCARARAIASAAGTPSPPTPTMRMALFLRIALADPDESDDEGKQKPSVLR